ncbi:MAG TPA: carbohydrate ABC transporter permease, partial [Bacilli bacterium]
MNSIKSGMIVSYSIQYVLMILGTVIFIFPLVWMVLRSLMGLADIYTIPPIIIPTDFTIKAYFEIWAIKPFEIFFKNSFIVVFFTIIGCTLSSSLCAFGFARLRFPLRNTIFGIVLATMMLPGAVTLIPVYVLFSKMGWINTLLPLTVPAFFGGGAFNIFLLRQFFLGIPRDFDEAARIDGASTWGIYWQIMLPLSIPALTVVAVFSFRASWDDFLGPLIYLNSEEKFTLPLGLLSMSPPNT